MPTHFSYLLVHGLSLFDIIFAETYQALAGNLFTKKHYLFKLKHKFLLIQGVQATFAGRDINKAGGDHVLYIVLCFEKAIKDFALLLYFAVLSNPILLILLLPLDEITVVPTFRSTS